MRLIVLSKTHAQAMRPPPSREGDRPWSCALYLSDNDVFKVRPQSVDPNLQGETWDAGLTLALRCHFTAKPGPQ